MAKQQLPSTLLFLTLDPRSFYTPASIADLAAGNRDRIRRLLCNFSQKNNFPGFEIRKGRSPEDYRREQRSSYGKIGDFIDTQKILYRGREFLGYSGAVWWVQSGHDALKCALFCCLAIDYCDSNRDYAADELLNLLPCNPFKPKELMALTKQLGNFLKFHGYVETSVSGQGWKSMVGQMPIKIAKEWALGTADLCSFVPPPTELQQALRNSIIQQAPLDVPLVSDSPSTAQVEGGKPDHQFDQGLPCSQTFKVLNKKHSGIPSESRQETIIGRRDLRKWKKVTLWCLAIFKPTKGPQSNRKRVRSASFIALLLIINLFPQLTETEKHTHSSNAGGDMVSNSPFFEIDQVKIPPSSIPRRGADHQENPETPNADEYSWVDLCVNKELSNPTL